MKVRAVGSGTSLHPVRSVSRIRAIRLVPLLALPLAACAGGGEPTDILILGGSVLDGSGREARTADVAVAGDRIRFLGDAASAGITARDTIDARGLVVAPGFIDMHSHAELDADHGRDADAPSSSRASRPSRSGSTGAARPTWRTGWPGGPRTASG